MRLMLLILLALPLISCSEASPQGRTEPLFTEDIIKCQEETTKAKRMADCLTIYLRDRKEKTQRGLKWDQPSIDEYMSASTCRSRLPAKK